MSEIKDLLKKDVAFTIKYYPKNYNLPSGSLWLLSWNQSHKYSYPNVKELRGSCMERTLRNVIIEGIYRISKMENKIAAANIDEH